MPNMKRCEMVWVLLRGSRYTPAQVAHALRTLLQVRQVVCHTPTVLAGLALLESGGDFADGVMAAEGDLLGCTLGEVLTEPKPTVWFDEPAAPWTGGGLRLDRRTRMMYDDRHIFINGESFRAGGADARLMRALADARGLSATQVQRASTDAQALLQDWFEAGWLHRSETA